MRIYCLSKVEEILPKENVIQNLEPYEEGADEISITFVDEHETPKRIAKYIGHSQFYGLTEISVGYLETQNRKIFAMFIYRKEFGIHKIRMIRGAIRLEKISDDIIDLYIANSKLYPTMLKHDLRIRLRCIKNTSTKGIISEEEEALYYDYEKQIKEFCDLMPDLQEDAFEHFQFTKHNTSTPKVFSERINNFVDLINFCCDPKTGRYRNVPTSNSRLYQKVENLLYQKSSWNVRKPREKALENQAKNFRDCAFIKWLNADLNNLTLKDVKTKKLKTVHFEEVNFFTSKNEIQPCLTHFDFSNLETLSLWHCKIKNLTKEFFGKLPETLLKLDVRENHITEISDTISKLNNLKELNLYKNQNLTDSGIPWEKLPTKIKDLNLGFTNITKIPSEIERLTSLETLNISSESLTSVAWTFINPTIEWLHIEGGGNMNDIDLSGKNRLQRIDISKAGLTAVDCSLLPPCLEALILCNNKLQHFNPGQFLPNLDQLILSDNELKSIEWKNLSPTINYLTLDKNQLTSVENISHLTNLLEITVNSNQINFISKDIQFLRRLIIFEASGNQISELPFGFEKLKSLKTLDLSNNRFNCDENETDLTKVLWQRLPKQNYIEYLCLNDNTLGKLPCMLKDIPIENLHVEGCKIKYICPQLYSKLQNMENCPHLNIRFNPIYYLPFIPQTIFQPPLKEPPTDSMYPGESYEPPRFHLRMEDERFIVTSKFPMASKKPKYEFETLETKIKRDKKDREPNFCCKCCAKCGAQKENFPTIEQLMVSDYAFSFDLVINEKPRILAGKGKKKELLKMENKSVVTTKQKFYCPGKWKTNVITRLCDDCIILMKAETNKAFEESKKDLTTEDVLSQKRSKEDNAQTVSLEPIKKLYDTNLSINNEVMQTSGLLLSNKFAVDCFLNAAVNAIAIMDEFMASICSNVEFSEYDSTHRKLVEILHHEITDVRGLRETLPSFHGNKQEDAGEAFLQIINSIDTESKKLINFSYKTISECSCRTTVRECNECPILNLTVTPSTENTFNSMLEQWQCRQNIRCSNCYKMATMKNFVEIGEKQEYLVIEINSWIKRANNDYLQISISRKDFFLKMQEIFDNFWELIGAIQYAGTGEAGHYLSWKKCNDGKWMVINDDKQRIEEDLLQDLKDYKILVFKKLPQFDIDLSDITVEENAENNIDETEHNFLYQNSYDHEESTKSIACSLPLLRNINYANPHFEQLYTGAYDHSGNELGDIPSNDNNYSTLITYETNVIGSEQQNLYQQPSQNEHRLQNTVEQTISYIDPGGIVLPQEDIYYGQSDYSNPPYSQYYSFQMPQYNLQNQDMSTHRQPQFQYNPSPLELSTNNYPIPEEQQNNQNEEGNMWGQNLQQL